MKMKFIGVLIMFGLSIFCYGVPITLTKLDCIINEESCANNTCNITKIRNRLSVMNFECNFVIPITNCTYFTGLYKKANGKYEKYLFENSGDMCELISQTGDSPLLTRFLPTLKKYGFNVTRCPVQGLVKIQNYPLDLSFFPSITPQGDFKLRVETFDRGHNMPIVTSDLFFTVKY